MSTQASQNLSTKSNNQTEEISKDSEITIELQLSNQTKIYTAGQTVTGTVLVNFPVKRTIRNISVEIRGNSSVSWMNNYRTKFTKYTSSQVHFKHIVNLHGEQFCEKPNQVCIISMEPGTYTYNLKHTLPLKIPSSFQGQHGGTKYIVEAKVNIPWDKDSSVSCQEEINIVATVRLESILKCYNPILIEITEKSLPIRASAKALYTGYTRGEEINFKINVQNHSKIQIEEVTLRLQQVTNYTSTKPYWSAKSETVPLHDVLLGGIDAGTFKNINTKMIIPDVIPSGLGYCSILDWEYLITLVLSLINGKDISQSCGIVIGTEKLQRKQTQEEVDISQLYY